MSKLIIPQKRFFLVLDSKSLTGYTLVEIVVTTVILTLITLGMLSVFVSGNKQVIHTRERMTSSELGKFFIDPLQMDVRQDTWATNPLGSGTIPGSSETINNRQFDASYVVADSTTDTALVGTDLRRVTATIIWTEPPS